MTTTVTTQGAANDEGHPTARTDKNRPPRIHSDDKIVEYLAPDVEEPVKEPTHKDNSPTTLLANELTKHRLRVENRAELNCNDQNQIVRHMQAGPFEEAFPTLVEWAKTLPSTLGICPLFVLNDREADTHARGPESKKIVFAVCTERKVLGKDGTESAEATSVPAIANDHGLANFRHTEGVLDSYITLPPKDFHQLVPLFANGYARERFMHQIDLTRDGRQVFYSVLHEGLTLRASDIHIDPSSDPATGDVSYQVRYRVDGHFMWGNARNTPLILEREKGEEVIQAVKVLMGIDHTNKHTPNDGRFTLDVRAIGNDLSLRGTTLRVSTVPTVDDCENMVVRIQRSVTLRDLTLDGLGKETATEIRRLINLPEGLFLVTGPTGSGKTTTLYSAIDELQNNNTVKQLSAGGVDVPDLKIVTVEDPVEIRRPGLVQVNVNRAQGLDFPQAIRAFLRQDPDVILVGEIRDEDTAREAMKGSQTGHIVLSTLHTKGAFETLMRLRDIGVSATALLETVTGIFAQRLVRVPCPDERCAPLKDRTAAITRLLGLSDEEKFDPEMLGQRFILPVREPDLKNPDPLKRPDPHCPHCRGTGYQGRIAIVELWTPTEEQGQIIQSDSFRKEDLMRRAIEDGFRPLVYSAFERLFAWQTTIEEIVTALGNDDRVKHPLYIPLLKQQCTAAAMRWAERKQRSSASQEPAAQSGSALRL